MAFGNEKTIEGCIARLDEMMAQWRKDDVRGVKQEPENMSDNDSETLKNDQNFVLEENEDIADEVEFEEEAKVEAEFKEEMEVGAQASRDIGIKVVVVKDPVQFKEPTGFEENGQLQAWLSGDNTYSMEQIVANQTPTVDLVKLIFSRSTLQNNSFVLGVSLSTKHDACISSPSMSSQTMTFMIVWPSKLSLTIDFYYTQLFFTQFP